MAEPVRALLAPYLDVVAGLNGSGTLTCYPGSPALARAFLRAQDRLIACELEPKAAAALTRNVAGDRRAKAIAIDGWTALNAYVPPPERRGIVLIDPPFEQEDDFAQLARGLETAHRKWAHGTFLVWYPIKAREQPDALARRLRRTGIAENPARRNQCRGRARRQPPRRLRPDRRQSALDACRRARHDAARAGGDPLGARRGSQRVDWLSGEALRSD